MCQPHNAINTHAQMTFTCSHSQTHTPALQVKSAAVMYVGVHDSFTEVFFFFSQGNVLMFVLKVHLLQGTSSSQNQRIGNCILKEQESGRGEEG